MFKKINVDQFCPLCYDDDGIMRNVYGYVEDKEKKLYCTVHGLVLYEDPDLKKYIVLDDVIGSSKIGEMIIG